MMAVAALMTAGSAMAKLTVRIGQTREIVTAPQRGETRSDNTATILLMVVTHRLHICSTVVSEALGSQESYCHGFLAHYSIALDSA